MSYYTETFYISLEDEDEYEDLIELFKKYNVGCVNSVYKCVAKCTFLKETHKHYEGDILFKFESDIREMESYFYTIGETIFQFPELAEYVAKKYFITGYMKSMQESRITERFYMTDMFKKYRLFKKLPFLCEEYFLLGRISYIPEYDLLGELKAEGFDYEDVIKEEEISLIPTKPENKYMDKVNTLYALLENEIEEKTKTTKGETYVIIDLDSIKNEIKDVFKDTEIKVSVLRKSLCIEEKYFILKYDETNEEGNRIYLYDDSEITKIEIAREIKKKETDCLY